MHYGTITLTGPWMTHLEKNGMYVNISVLWINPVNFYQNRSKTFVRQRVNLCHVSTSQH